MQTFIWVNILNQKSAIETLYTNIDEDSFRKLSTLEKDKFPQIPA